MSRLYTFPVIVSILIIGIFTVSWIPISFAQTSTSDPSKNIVAVTVPIDDVILNPGEIMVVLDTTGTNTLDLVSTTANLPCGSGPTGGAGNDMPDLKIIAGILGDTFDVIGSSGDDTGFAGPLNTCVFRDLADSASQGITINTVLLTNDGADPVAIPKGVLITLTGAFEDTDPPPTTNNPPTANAGPVQTVNEGTLVQLDGTASSDPDGDPLTYSWTQTQGPAVTLSDSTIANPTFTAPEVSTTTILQFNLAVSDQEFTINDTVDITVQDIPSSTFNTANLIAYYKFNEASGPLLNRCNDTGGSCSPALGDGTVFGTTRGVSGILESAYSFSGSFSDRVEINGSFGPVGDISISYWMRSTASYNANDYYIRIATPGGHRIDLVDNPAYPGHFICEISASSGITTARTDTGPPIRDGAWHHIVCVRDWGDTLTLYVDSVPILTKTDTAGTVDPGASITLSTASSNAYEGDLDELTIFERVLTQSEIQELYNNGLGLDLLP